MQVNPALCTARACTHAGAASDCAGKREANTMSIRRIPHAACAAVLTSLLCSAGVPAAAQQYPSRTITAVVAAAAGGYADAVARIVAERLSAKLGQNVVVENRGGGGGNIGAKAVAGAAPDGHTILVTTTALAINETLYKNKGYALSDLKPAAIAVSAPEVILANPSLPAKNLAELVKESQGKTVTYGSAGVGTGSYIAAAYFFKMLAKVDTVHVPFPGGAPAINAILGNHISVLAVTVPPVIASINGGKIRGLGIASARRMELVSSVPTYAENGYPNFYASSWVGFFLPAKTGDAIVERLNREINDALQDPAVQARLKPFGVELLQRSQADTAKFLESEVDHWGKMVQTLGLSVN
jgi:tripartite-type tricarboxylate transporter receptor subunit TctC